MHAFSNLCLDDALDTVKKVLRSLLHALDSNPLQIPATPMASEHTAIPAHPSILLLNSRPWLYDLQALLPHSLHLGGCCLRDFGCWLILVWMRER